MKSFLFAARVVGVGLLAFVSAHAATPGVGRETIILGQSAPFTGAAASLGKSMRDGARLYFDEVNRDGGVHGRRIALVSLDDGYQPDRAVENTQLFIEDDGIFALFGYVGTPVGDAVRPIAIDANVPFYGVFTELDGQSRPAGGYVLDLRSGRDEGVEPLVSFLVARGNRRIAVLYRDDTDGNAALRQVQAELAAHDLVVVATGAVDGDTAEIDTALQAISMARPDAVIMASDSEVNNAFVQALEDLGQSPEYVDVAFAGSNDKLEGYLAAKAFVDGLRFAGRNLTRENFVHALALLRDDKEHLHFSAGGAQVPDDKDYLHLAAGSAQDEDKEYLQFAAGGEPVPDDDREYLNFSAGGEQLPVIGINRAVAE